MSSTGMRIGSDSRLCDTQGCYTTLKSVFFGLSTKDAEVTKCFLRASRAPDTCTEKQDWRNQKQRRCCKVILLIPVPPRSPADDSACCFRPSKTRRFRMSSLFEFRGGLKGHASLPIRDTHVLFVLHVST